MAGEWLGRAEFEARWATMDFSVFSARFRLYDEVSRACQASEDSANPGARRGERRRLARLEALGRLPPETGYRIYCLWLPTKKRVHESSKKLRVARFAAALEENAGTGEGS